MTQTVVECNIDFVSGTGSITIKTSEGGVDTYSLKDITVTPGDIDSIVAILNTYIN